jgi:hypothetical protein
MQPSGQTYVDPACDTGDLFDDCYIYIWVEAESGSDVTMEFEQVHNWEAIPHPANEFLFERKAVVSSDEAISLARQNTSTPAVATAARHSGSLSAPQPKGKSFWSQIE